MAIVVEDGTGLTNADAYISVAGADAYHAAQGSPAAWTAATTSDKEDAIRQATTYLDGKYARAWRGMRAHRTQALRWPRIGAIDIDGYELPSTAVPVRLGYAAAELALKVIEGTALTADVANSGASTLLDRVKVGPIEVEERFSDGSSGSQQTRFVKAAQLIADLIESGLSLERA